MKVPQKAIDALAARKAEKARLKSFSDANERLSLQRIEFATFLAAVVAAQNLTRHEMGLEPLASK